ncbi:MAG: methylenetetrahydrofolate reductase [Bacteroidetes bacterium]|nr:methylenetetrahydrofolate reductase [Bacteroidota bacterium]
MKVTEHLVQNAGQLRVSVEIIPPKRGARFQRIQDAIESVIPFNPPFIDVTSHSAEVMWEEMKDGTYRKIVKRKSPGTFGLCAAIKYKYNVDPVPHILCSGFTREETEDALIELNYLGVENLLLIRGDSKYDKPIREGRSANKYALDLVCQVSAMNQGKYLDELIDADATHFCIGVAAYPEKHFEAPNVNFDIDILKRKQDAGAHYAVTQLFYNNDHFLDFVARARAAGITMPIIPGLKIFTTREHLTVLPKIFHTDLPDELVDRIMAARDDREVRQVGIEWAHRQSIGLMEAGYMHLHYYIMQNTSPFVQLMERLRGAGIGSIYLPSAKNPGLWPGSQVQRELIVDQGRCSLVCPEVVSVIP